MGLGAAMTDFIGPALIAATFALAALLLYGLGDPNGR